MYFGIEQSWIERNIPRKCCRCGKRVRKKVHKWGKIYCDKCYIYKEDERYYEATHPDDEIYW